MKPQVAVIPHAIIMVGIPGAGKTAFAEKFAETFQSPMINRLKLQKDLELNNQQADAVADIMLKEFVKTKRTLLVEGGLDSKDERDALAKKLAPLGYRTLVVWVQTDTAEAQRRASKPYPHGSGIQPEDFDAIIQQFQPPGEKEHPVVISGKHTYATQLKIVLKQLALAMNSTPPTPQPQPSRGSRTRVR